MASATCAGCSTPLAAAHRFCPECGIPAGVSDTPTHTAPHGPRSPSPAPASRQADPDGSGTRRSSSAVPGAGRFAAGDLVAERYRVVGLLGRGGMGEVYRADDLQLGQTVALKFLPEGLARDPDRLARLYNEVRVAREVTHSAVCRVHDVGGAQGIPFLSMEYVDGENLASLLKRIGRLPAAKALDIARQLCAGLGAAHARGVLHRDLKPENVMLDGRGKVRITDFGLASLVDAIRGDEARSGTPAYMSPEQLAGLEVTPRSDVYALGLLLYELFTGRRPFEGPSVADLTRQHLDQPPLSPSALVEDMDPIVERAILRCLEKEPARRPASVLAVAAALPGGDPLTAALAAGETPAPDVVAAAGEREGLLPPSAVLGAAAAVLAGTLAVPFLSGHFQLFHQVPMDKAPAVLEDRARELLGRLGVDEPAVDRASGLAVDADYVQHLASRDRSPRRWAVLANGRPPAVHYWYRQSPRPLVSTHLWGAVSSANPRPVSSGMAGVRLDMRGRLLELYVVPPQVEPAGPSRRGEPPDWTALLHEAGLEAAQVTPVEPLWTPPFHTDARAAWETRFPESADDPVRVEAAAYGGRPSYFKIVQPWTRPDRMRPFQLSDRMAAAQTVGVGLLVCLVAAAAFLARRNVRLGRGDRRGAMRLSWFSFVVGIAAWALDADHVPEVAEELDLVFRGVAGNLAIAGQVWLLYLALEPYVRRRWPHTLISWTRLLDGRLGDPRVGRDGLLGALSGVVVSLLLLFFEWLPPRLGEPAPMTAWWTSLEPLESLPRALGWVLAAPVACLAVGMGLVLLLLLLRILLRHDWAAYAVFAVVLSIQPTLIADSAVWVIFPAILVLRAILVFLIVRLGLLATLTGFYVSGLLLEYPMSPHLAGWTGHATILAFLVIGALTLHCARAALAGRPLLGAALDRS